MSSKLKGQLGLKSGPLAPTSSKLTTQYLVLDHMNNHFNKIAKAKSAIDTRPPKSLTTSQKMRDRKSRTRLSSSPHTRPMSAMTQQEIQQYEDLLNDEPEDDEERLVHSIMRSTLIEKSKGSNNANYGSESAIYLNEGNTCMSQQSPYYSQSRTTTRPLSARSVGSFTNCLRTSIPVKSHDQNRITYAGDILEKRAHKFTEPERPFTPRINNSNHKSRLRSSKCYNPPKPTPSPKKSNNIYAYRESKAAKEVRHNRSLKKSNANDSRDLGESLDTAQLSESMLMDITLRSRDARHEMEADDQVPRLDISMDKDHLNWLQEQATKAKVRARSAAQIPKSHLMGDITPIAEEHSARSGNSLRTETKLKEEHVHKRQSSSWLSCRIYVEEEEQKYLSFAKEVTDDVLSRGISTDKVLNRVFESHIDRRKHDLDETRMRGVIHDLKKDLGLRECGQEKNLDQSLTNFNYSNHKVDKNETVGESSISRTDESQSEKSTLRDGVQTNGFSSSNFEPRAFGSTMESTSTMQFGQTADVFSTIKSEATLEREAEGEETEGGSVDELGSTHDDILKQYQLTLKVTEAENGVRSSDVSPNSQKLERPATGERRTSLEDPSETSTVSGKPTRARRRHRPMKKYDSFDDVNSSEYSTQTNGFNGTLTNGSNGEYSQSTDATGNNGTLTGSSSVIQKPTAKPRSVKMTDLAQESITDKASSTAESLEDIAGSRRASSVGETENETETKEEEDDEYEDDYDEEDEEQGGTTHRTSDDDF